MSRGDLAQQSLVIGKQLPIPLDFFLQLDCIAYHCRRHMNRALLNRRFIRRSGCLANFSHYLRVNQLLMERQERAVDRDNRIAGAAERIGAGYFPGQLVDVLAQARHFNDAAPLFISQQANDLLGPPRLFGRLHVEVFTRNRVDNCCGMLRVGTRQFDDVKLRVLNLFDQHVLLEPLRGIVLIPDFVEAGDVGLSYDLFQNPSAANQLELSLAESAGGVLRLVHDDRLDFPDLQHRL